MSQKNYIIMTFSRLLSARLLYRMFTAISIIIVANYLIADPKLLDIFDVSAAIVSIIMIASEVGMSMVVMRSGAQHTKEELARYYGNALLIETLAWLILYVIVIGSYGAFNGFNTMFWLLAIMGVGQAVIQYRVVMRSIFRSLYAKEWITFIEVLDGIFKLIGTYAIVKTVSDLTMGAYYIAGWHSLTTIIFVGIYGWSTIKLVPPKLNRALLNPMLKEGLWFSMQALVMTVYFELDKLMLRLFQNMHWADIADGDIGRYSAAARIAVFLLLFHRIGLQIITPYLYATFGKHMNKFRRIVHLSTNYIGALGIGMGVGLIVLADEIMQFLYKPALWNAAPALQLFGWFILIRFIGITSSQVFATTNHQPLRTKLEFASVLLNLVLDIIFIPLYGFLGGALATLIAELVIQIVFYIITRHLIQDQLIKPLLQLLPAIIAGVGMAIVIILLKNVLPLLGLCVVGIFVYGVILLATGFIKISDIKQLKSASR